jgi:hypothetical protein
MERTDGPETDGSQAGNIRDNSEFDQNATRDGLDRAKLRYTATGSIPRAVFEANLIARWLFPTLST